MNPKNHSSITAEAVRAALSYDPDTGLFLWIKAGPGVTVGAPAGHADSCGYLQIKFSQKICRVHRLAWLYVYGSWPEGQLDHINGIRTDNRIANLRKATNSENGQNRALQRNSTSKHAGVHFHKRHRKWRAQIQVNGDKKHLGYFDCIEQAIAARAKAKAEMHAFQPFDRIQATL